MQRKLGLVEHVVRKLLLLFRGGCGGGGSSISSISKMIRVALGLACSGKTGCTNVQGRVSQLKGQATGAVVAAKEQGESFDNSWSSALYALWMAEGEDKGRALWQIEVGAH